MDDAAIKRLTGRISSKCGVLMGALLTGFFLCMVYASKLPMLLILFMMASVPVYDGLVIAYAKRATKGEASFGRLWFVGLSVFVFGTLLAMLMIVLWLTYVEPTYIYDMAQLVLETYKGVPALENTVLVYELERAITTYQLPTPFDVAVNISVLTILSGAVYSMFAAMVVKLSKSK